MVRVLLPCLILVLILMGCSSGTRSSPETTPTMGPDATSTPPEASVEPSPTFDAIDPDLVWTQLVAELDRLAMPIDIENANENQGDIRPVLDLVDGAMIVGLGEATHGTSEFVTLRVLIIRLLIEEAGFRDIALEAPWTGIELVNEYVQGETDDVDAAQAGLSYFMFRNHEFWDVVEWARTHNETAGAEERIRFTGIDPRGSSEAAVEIVLDYVETVDPDQAGGFADHYSHIRDIAGSAVSSADSQAAYELLLDRREAYTDLSSEDEFELVLQAARVIAQGQQIHAFPNTERNAAYGLREESMAENLNWARQQAGADSRFILWGHNLHVAKILPPPLADVPPLGGLLRDQLRDDYVTIGMDFAAGSFVARQIGQLTADLETFTVDSAPEGSYAEIFAELEADAFILNLDLDDSSHAARFLGTPSSVWSIGSGFSPDDHRNVIVEVDLTASYDALIFVRETTGVSSLDSSD